MQAWIADLLIVLGLGVISVGVYGVLRLPDVYTQLHASSKAAFLGVTLLLAAAASTGDAGIIVRAVVISALLAVTTPVAAHAIAQAADQRAEPMRTPGAVDERRRRRADASPPGDR